jgi:hypothetical protein
VGNVSTLELARSAGVEDYIHLHPAGSRTAARELLGSSHVLVSLPWPGKEQVPAKIYEYADFAAWLFALAAPDTSPAERLHGTSAVVVAPDDERSIELQLESLYRRFLAGEAPTPANATGALSRAREAHALADLLDAAILSQAR